MTPHRLDSVRIAEVITHAAEEPVQARPLIKDQHRDALRLGFSAVRLSDAW